MEDDMDTVKLYYGGTIYTVNDMMPYAEAMAVKGKRIIAIGNLKTVEKDVAGEVVERINLEGKFLMPSFVESHAHPAMAGPEMLFQVNLDNCQSGEECVKAIEKFYDENHDIEMIRGVGWVNPYFDDKGPRKELLDEVSVDKPIIMVSGDHHSVWCNSKALEDAGITAASGDVIGGVVERDDVTNEPLGTLREEAQFPVLSRIPPYTEEEYEASWLNYQQVMAQYGITMVHDAWTELNSNAHRSVSKLASEDRLLFKVASSIYTKTNDVDYIDMIIKEGKELNNKNFNVRHAKFFIDGVVEGNTAWLKEPYADNPEFCGEKLWSDENLEAALLKLDENGWSAQLHVIGDAATEQVVRVMEKIEAKNGYRDRRTLLAHVQLVDDKDIPRMADLNFVVSANPFWFLKQEGYFYNLELPRLGKERANQQYRVKSFMDAGIVVASASDFSVTPIPAPLIGIAKGVLRREPKAEAVPENILTLEEAVSVEDMIKSFTINGAYSVFMEEETGSLEEGKLADFIILEENILEISPERIEDVKILNTFSEGKEIYRG